MKKLFSLGVFILLFVFTLFTSSGKIHAAVSTDSIYTFANYSLTSGGVTLNIDSSTQIFTINGTGGANFTLPSLFTANAAGSSLSSSSEYVVYYDYISGSFSGVTSWYVFNLPSASASFPGSQIGMRSEHYLINHGTYIPAGTSTVQPQVNAYTGTYVNYTYKLTVVPYDDTTNDLDIFSQDYTGTSEGITINITGGDTVMMNGSTPLTVISGFDLLSITTDLDPNKNYIFKYVYVSGTVTSSGSVTASNLIPFRITALKSIVRNHTVSTYDAAIAHSGNITYFRIDAKYLATSQQVSYNLFTFKILVEEIGLAVTDTTVTFDSAGGSTIGSMVVTYNSTITLPDAPTKEGYTFDGWLLEGIAFDPSTLITSDITLVASWIENPPEVFTVTFDSAGGSAVSDQAVSDGELATAPPDPMKTGYTFIHWYIHDPLVAYSFSTPVTSGLLLHASYQNNTYTVTFQDDQTLLDTEDVNHGEPITGFIPTKEGFSFQGWLLEGTSFNLETAITGNIILYASWLEDDVITYTISFNSNGGSEVLNITVLPDAYAIAPTAPTKESYTFTGWYLDPGLTQIFSFINTSISENITLYAKWTSEGGGVIIPPEESQSFLIEIIGSISSVIAIAAAIITKKKGK